jgi:hypothetical protein
VLCKDGGKEETPKCRKKTVTWTNEMIEDLIDFIEIHPIVAFEAIYEKLASCIPGFIRGMIFGGNGLIRISRLKI